MVKRKWFKSGIIILATVVTLLGGKALTTQAATTKEALSAGEEMVMHSDKNNDECIYPFTAPDDGYFTVTVRKIDCSEYCDFKVIDAGNNALTGNYSTSTSETTCIIPVAKGVVNYVWLDGYHWGVEGDWGITVNYTADKQWEKNNNSADDALALSSGKVVYGTISTCQKSKAIDDYYSFTIKQNSVVNITYGPKDIGGNGSFRCDLVSSDNRTASNTRFIGSSSSILTQKVYLKAGTYYLIVRECNSAGNTPYQISYKASSLKVSKPTIKSVLIKKRTYDTYRYVDSIKLSGVKVAEGYQVKLSTKKNLKSAIINDAFDINNNNVTTSKINNLTYKTLNNSQKKYYTSVKSYVYDAFGEKIYGSWSAKKSVTK